MHSFFRYLTIVLCFLISFTMSYSNEVNLLVLPSEKIDISQKSKWLRLNNNNSSVNSNGLAMENDLLLVLIKPGEAMITLFGKNGAESLNDSIEIVFKDLKDHLIKIKSVKSITLNNGIQLDVLFSNESMAQIYLTPDASSLKINSDPNIKSIQILAKMNLIFRPDFFDTNMIYEATMPIFSKGWSYIPVENYLFGLLSENAIVGIAWNSKKTGVKISLKEKELNFNSLQLDLDLNDPVVFIGVIKSSKSFITTNFKGVLLDQESGEDKLKIKYANIITSWNAPYIARWTALVLHSIQDNSVPSSVPVTRMWRLRTPKVGPGQEQKTWESSEFIWEKGIVSESDKRLWHPKVLRGAMYNGKDTLEWNIESRFVPYTIGLVIPLARESETPSNVVTIVDFVREALGEKSLENVLDIPGLKDRQMVDGHQTPLASCGAMDAARIKIINLDNTPDNPATEERKEDVRKRILEIQWYFQLLADRAQEYLEAVNMLEKYAADQSKISLGCKLLAEAILASCSEIRKEWRIENGKADTLTRKHQDAFWEEYRTTLVKWERPLAKLNNQCRNKQIADGNSCDSFVNKACKGIKRIIWAAYIIGGNDEESLKMAKETIIKCHNIMRFRHWMEDKSYIERSLFNPPRKIETFTKGEK
jgi:hypothetical protein